MGKEIAKIGFAKAMSKKWIKLADGSKDVIIRVANQLDDLDKD